MRSLWSKAHRLLIIMGVVILGACPSHTSFHRDTSDTRENLLAILSGCRPFSGRLSGQVPYLPFRRKCLIVVPKHLLLQLGSTPKDNKPRAFADRAVLNLLAGKHNKSVSLLDSAVGLSSDNPYIANDLAVAYLARADDRGNTYDLILALGALLRAEKLAPHLDEVQFNLALVLGRLRLRSDAAAAWRAYLRQDLHSKWRGAALKILAGLQENSRTKEWNFIKRSLQEAAIKEDKGLTALIVTKYRQEARIWVQQEVLANWAREHLQRNNSAAERELCIARAVGVALADINGEKSVIDSVGTI